MSVTVGVKESYLDGGHVGEIAGRTTKTSSTVCVVYEVLLQWPHQCQVGGRLFRGGAPAHGGGPLALGADERLQPAGPVSRSVTLPTATLPTT